ncbi:MAG TPA: 3-dehydroquinate synthase [Chitinophagaceae bacterium]|nr:3-dehydroquinate synthase [Chitinophagaceae bacterium]
MEEQQYIFSGKKVNYYFDASLADLSQYVDRGRTILIVDDKVNRLHGDQLKNWRKIVVKGAEESKSLDCFQQVVDELIRMEADRKTMLVGIGGGVVTDLTGFVASVYMRGISYAFVPTTLLAQVDASVGGKNGVNYGRYKNILGVIRQPDFLLFDYTLLDTLDERDLYNGFAEIIKYACFGDLSLFDYLENNREKALKRNREVIGFLVKRSVEIKSNIVQKDEFEGGLRRLLNFGHTVGHAVEKIEKIPHGQAVAKGMVIAAQFSTVLNALSEDAVSRMRRLIEEYHLPINIESRPEDIEQLFKMDKKREKDFIHFILLNELGKGKVIPVKMDRLSELLNQFITNK